MGTKEKEAPHDLLKIKNVKVIPTPPIPAGNSFTFTLQVENLDQKKTATHTSVSLYDTGRCKKDRVTPRKKWDMFPGSTKVLEWNIRAPSNKKLGYMTGECPLRYEAEYTFHAHTRAEAITISREKLEEASKMGETVSVSSMETKSRGPIKVDVRFGSEQPFREASLVPFNVIVQNKGSGGVAELENGDVNITLLKGGGEEVTGFDQWKYCSYSNERTEVPEGPRDCYSTADLEAGKEEGLSCEEFCEMKTAMRCDPTLDCCKESADCYADKTAHVYNLSKDTHKGVGCDWSEEDWDLFDCGCEPEPPSVNPPTENRRLPFIKDETSPIVCEYNFTAGIDQTAPLKTYIVKVDVPSYNYTISGEKIVQIEPTYERR